MKKCFSLVLVFILMFSLCAVPALAVGESGTDNLLCPECGETLHVKVTNTGIYQQYEYECAACGYVRNEESLLGFEKVDGSSATPVQDSSLLEGYADIDNGISSIDSDGKLIYVLDLTKRAALASNWDYMEVEYFDDRVVFSSTNGNEQWTGIKLQYSFEAPVTGLYEFHVPRYKYVYLDADGYYGPVLDSYTFKADVTKYTDGAVYGFAENSKLTIEAEGWNGQVEYSFLKSTYSEISIVKPFYCVVTPSSSLVQSSNNITINGIQFNGNIHIDPTLNLTFIYPEYNVTDDNGDTQVNISDNPIIYNKETNQFYTYDSETNNYYYIIVPGLTPTPSPSPSPSPTPSPTPGPGETTGPDEPTPTPTPGGGGDTPGGGGSGGDGDSGGGILGWLGELLGDIIKGILGLLFKLVGAIVSFITWLVSKAGSFFPWLPAGCIVALSAGVVIVTILRIIKFILGR